MFYSDLLLGRSATSWAVFCKMQLGA